MKNQICERTLANSPQISYLFSFCFFSDFDSEFDVNVSGELVDIRARKCLEAVTGFPCLYSCSTSVSSALLISPSPLALLYQKQKNSKSQYRSKQKQRDPKIVVWIHSSCSRPFALYLK